MATPVIMPKFGMAQEDGTIIRWLKQEGDVVEKGDILLEVQTDKVDMEVEAPASGVLRGILYGPDVTLPVTTVIAHIVEPGEALPATPVSTPGVGQVGEQPEAPRAPGADAVKASPVAQRMAAATGVDLGAISGSGPAGRILKADVQQAMAQRPATAELAGKVRATPAARRLARDAGVSLQMVSGTGPAGRVQAADVERTLTAAKAPAVATPPAAAAGGEPLRGKRHVIATRLAQSWRTVPHIFLSTTIEMTQAEQLRSQLGAEVEAAGARLTPTVLMARATAAALARHPRLNAWLREDGSSLLLTEHQQIDLGIAVALPDGLIVPVVRGAQGLGLVALATQISDLARRAREGALSPDEVTGATFTISNLGMYPINHFTAIINPPQVAILAVGRTQMQPVWNGESFNPRPAMEVTLSADHRAVDGAIAAAFLADLKQLLEEPARMLL